MTDTYNLKNIHRQNPVCGYQNHLVSNLIYKALICSRWMRTDIWLWNGPNPSYHINSFERYKDLSSEWRSKVEHKAELQVSRKSVKEAFALCITQPDFLCWGPVANGNCKQCFGPQQVLSCGVPFPLSYVFAAFHKHISATGQTGSLLSASLLGTCMLKSNQQRN